MPFVYTAGNHDWHLEKLHVPGMQKNPDTGCWVLGHGSLLVGRLRAKLRSKRHLPNKALMSHSMTDPKTMKPP